MASSFRLDTAIDDRLNALAKQTGRTKTFYIRELILNGIDALENYYQNQKANRVPPSRRRSGTKP